jgi:hypothetical protein
MKLYTIERLVVISVQDEIHFNIKQENWRERMKTPVVNHTRRPTALFASVKIYRPHWYKFKISEISNYYD